METKTVTASPRLQRVFDDLVTNLRQFIRDNQITHADYRNAVAFLLETAKAGELKLLLDVLLEATVDQIESMGRSGTETSVEGPFYLPNSPTIASPAVLPHRTNEPGEVLILSGMVHGLDGNPLGGAVIDIWQADAEGNYSYFNIPVEGASFNLRGRVIADKDGAYEIQTWMPSAYQIPKDGPTGAILKATGRHPWRPAHIHFRIEHPGYETLTTQLFVAGDPWIDSDVVGAVKQSLVINFEKHTDPEELQAHGLTKPFRTARFDFVLPGAIAPTAT
jgi:catechol 1,2-dioxygenase